jgi:TatD DNase family protein
MPLIDTHTHLESFVRHGMLATALDRARAAGVEAMIAIGTAPDDWAMYREIAKANEGFVHYSVGLHPCSVESEWEIALAQVEAFWQADPTGGRVLPAALGEIGLDRFHLPKDSVEAERIFGWQRSAFAGGLAIARRIGCPVVIHSRGAFRDCVEMIDASGVDWTRVVFHCFTEGEAEMAELARRGGFGSFTGILTYKTAVAVRAAAKAQGLGRLMLETDAPYLTPMPHRGKPNEPAFVRHTAEFAAQEVFDVSFEELAGVTTANARQFFRLPGFGGAKT